MEAPVAAWLVQDAQLLSEGEKDQMACIMTQLTTLNKEWATRQVGNRVLFRHLHGIDIY